MMHMWQWLVQTLQAHPELAIFLTLAMGYWVGALKLGSFSLGAVTGTLLAGVLVGQLDIEISAQIKSVFFVMFLFALGNSDLKLGPRTFPVKFQRNDGITCTLTLSDKFGYFPLVQKQNTRAGRITHHKCT